MLLQLVLKRAEGFAPAPEGDAALLRRFAANGDEAAFAGLLQRHGAMVWSVCRHLLEDDTEAEDAFQAVFLALVRSAKRVRDGATVGAWLHGVAVRIATKVKRTAARRRKREERAAEPEADRPIPEAAWNDLLAAVHEEVQRLPEHLRTAFVLCELEGVRQPDAAARLGWKPGTLTGRLARARQMIVQRLTDRGLAPALAGGGLAIGLATASAAVPVQMIDTTLSLIRAGGTIPSTILNLAKEASPMMAMRSKLAAAAVLFAGGLGTMLLPLASAQFSGNSGQPPAGGPPGSVGVGQPGAGGLPGPGGGIGGPARSEPFSVPLNPKTQWEYQFARAAKDPKKQITDLGNDGWEYCGQLPGDIESMVFKRPKTPAPRGFGGGVGGGFSGFDTPPPMIPGGGLPPLPSGSGSSGGPPGGVFGGSGPAVAPPAAAPLVVFQLRHAAAADLVTVLEKLFPKNLTIAVEPRTNSLILSGNKQMIEEAKALIEKLDTRPTMPPSAKP